MLILPHEISIIFSKVKVSDKINISVYFFSELMSSLKGTDNS